MRAVEVLRAIVDRSRAQSGDQVMLRLGRGAPGLDAGQTGEFEEGRADAARCAVDQDPVALSDVGDTMKHLVGAHIAQHEDDRLGSIETLGHRHQLLRWDTQVLAVTAVERQGGHGLADRQTCDARANLVHHTNHGVAWRERRSRGARISPATQVDVREGHIGCADPDPHLASPRRGKIVLHDLKHLRAAQSADDDAAIPCGSLHRVSLRCHPTGHAPDGCPSL